jgi:hypothetical protein
MDESVTGIPSSARAGAVEEHLDTALNSCRYVFQAIARTRDLV